MLTMSDSAIPESLPSGETVAQLLASAEKRLQPVDPGPFSDSAFSLLTSKVSEYIGELISEADKLARRQRADVISAAHVQRATENLISSTERRLFRYVGTIGGILLGAALSNIITAIATEQFSVAGTALASGLGIVGAFAVAFHMAQG